MLDSQEKFLLKSMYQNRGKGNLQYVSKEYQHAVALNFNDILNEDNNLPRWINSIRKAHQSLKDKNLISGFELGEWSLSRDGFEIARSLFQIKPFINKLVLHGNEQAINDIQNNNVVTFEILYPFDNSIIEPLDYPVQGVLVIETKKRLIFNISKLELIDSYLYLEVFEQEIIEASFYDEYTNEHTLEISLKNNIHLSPVELSYEDDRIPSTIVSTIVRRVRDTSMSQNLKKLYKDHCQICGKTIQTGNNKYYSEAHHLKPLGSPHFGPDINSNLIVLCPNHHVEFDAKSISLNPDTLLIEHIDKKNQFANSKLKLSLHTIDLKFIRYHHKLFKKNFE